MMLSLSNPTTPTPGTGFDYARLPEAAAVALRQSAAVITRAGQTMIDNVCQIADALEAARQLVDPGTYTAWVEAELPFSKDTEERIRNAARLYRSEPGLLDLAPTTAALLINAPDSARQEVIDLTAGGQPPSTRQTRVIVNAHKAAVDVATQYHVNDIRTVSALSKLARNGSETLDEIKATGYIQPGDETEAVHISSDPVEVERAIQKKQQQHRDLARDVKAAARDAAGQSLWVRFDENGGFYAICGFSSQAEAEAVLMRAGYGNTPAEGVLDASDENAAVDTRPLTRWWVSWWSGNYAHEGCTVPPFQYWTSGYRERAEGTYDDCSLCAVIDAHDENEIWKVVELHFPNCERRFCDPCEPGWEPGDRFPIFRNQTSLLFKK